MGSVVVCGGSVIGLSTAMLLARDGHQVTVLERDPAPPPAVAAGAWDDWERKGVAQFHQPHNLFPRFRQILDDELPGVVDDLVAAGCVWLDPVALLPPSIEDRSPRPGDERFRFVTGRRPVVEAVLAEAAVASEGVRVRRGTGVAGLVAGAEVVDGVAHVRGVRTTDGQEVAADLVVDATGRRSRLGEWLQVLGGRPPRTESQDCGFVYHTRYFRGPGLPAMIGPPVAPIGTISMLTLPGDNGSWSVTVWSASDDIALRSLRHTDGFTNVVRACPLQAHWLEGEPITDVLSMAGILDRYRRFVVDGVPVATGVVAVGDAWACTNPSAGRGMTVGLIHARVLRDVVRETDPGDPEMLVRAFDEMTETEVTPFYRSQVAADRARLVEMDALRRGDEPPPPDPTRTALSAAMNLDADAFRGVLDIMLFLATPEEVVARPGMRDKLEAVDISQPMRTPGPDRNELLALLD